MLISRRGYNWNNVLSPSGGPISGRAYNRSFMVVCEQTSWVGAKRSRRAKRAAGKLGRG